MNRIGSEQIEVLAREQSGSCVSIYLPTGRDALRDEQNQLRFRNALGQAEQELARQGMPADEIGWLLDPARELLTTPTLWSERGGGLAVFISPAGAWTHSLPYRPPEQVVVGQRFHLMPLLPLVSDEDQHSVRAIERVEQWLGTERGSGDLREIVPAACNARIDTLVISSDALAWGTFDPASEQIDLRPAQRQPGDEDLINLAAMESLLSGATVRVVERADVPGVTVAAAVFRYPRVGSDAPGSHSN